jgi:hypothetical protein
MATAARSTAATTQDKPATSTEWWKDPAYQNLAIQLINDWQQSQAGNDAAAVTQNNLSAVQGMRPTGMDFSAYQPLLSVIGDQSFTRGNAIKDSQGFIENIFREFETQSLPQIYKNQRASGIYNDTSTQLLANDAYSSAVAKGQANLFQNILAYSQARNQQLNPVMQLMQGQVSNSNALMGANAQYTNALLQALNANGAVGVANNNANRGQDVATLGALINAGSAAYNQWQQNQQQQQQNPYGDGTNVEQSDEIILSDGSTFSA